MSVERQRHEAEGRAIDMTFHLKPPHSSKGWMTLYGVKCRVYAYTFMFSWTRSNPVQNSEPLVCTSTLEGKGRRPAAQYTGRERD